MNEREDAACCATVADLRAVVAGHADDIRQIRGALDTVEGGLQSLTREVAVVRAEGQARAEATAAALDRLGGQITELTRQIASQTGAQEERNRLAQAALLSEQQRGAQAATRLTLLRRRLAALSMVLTVLAAIGGTLLSSQTWDDWVFGNVRFLHHTPGWAQAMQGGGHAVGDH